MLAPLTASANPQPSFDGAWSVSVMTQKGECATAYRYSVLIVNGVLNQQGSGDAIISGRVHDNGSVTVTVIQGDKKAAGSGRLAENAGGGRWSGNACSGSWRAERG